MLIFQPPVNFCSDKNIETIFGTKLEDFLNYRIDYNLISQTVEKVVKKIFLGRRNNSTAARVAPLSAQPAPDDLQFWTLSELNFAAEQLFYLPFCRKTMFNSKKKNGEIFH
jgi:hypothetical protein